MWRAQYRWIETRFDPLYDYQQGPTGQAFRTVTETVELVGLLQDGLSAEPAYQKGKPLTFEGFDGWLIDALHMGETDAQMTIYRRTRELVDLPTSDELASYSSTETFSRWPREG